MKVEIRSTEIEKLQHLLHRYTNEFRQDANRLVMGHSRTLVKDLIKYTPPFAQASNEFGPRKIGEKAVEREIKRTVVPFTKFKTTDQKIGNRINKLAREGNVSTIEMIFNNIPSLQQMKVVPFSPSLHESVRLKGDRLKVSKSQNKLTLDVKEWENYTRKVKQQVGKLKGYWAPLANRLQVGIPAYIQRHALWGLSHGRTEIELGAKPRVVAEITNAHYRKALQNTINVSLAFRIAAMIRDLQHRINYTIRQQRRA